MTNLVVIKRDGAKLPFTNKRIATAVQSAGDATGCLVNDSKYAQSVADSVETQLAGRTEVPIQEIQTLVENELMKGDYPQVARAYIEYRHDRDVTREKSSALNKEIQGLIDQSNAELLNENANKDGKVIPTQRDLLAGIVAKHYAKTHILPQDVVFSHEKGQIHYHDMDYAPFFPMFNCMLIDLENMLTNGFKMNNAEIDTPKSIYTAAAVTSQIINQVASNIYGGNTINGIDTILAPYVEMSHDKWLEIGKEEEVKDPVGFAMRRTTKETYDAMQLLEYSTNSLASSNGQTPFCSIGFGLGETWSSKLIQKTILDVRIKGLGKKGKTPVFPKLILAIKDGVNHKPSDPNYDIKQLALECASKRMYPDILNYEKVVEVTGSFKTPMGCRSFLNAYEKNGELVHDGRNNLGVVSLNLPRIAIEANGDEEKFFKLLDDRLALSRRALDTRIDRLRGVKAKVAPILYCEGACGVRLDPEDSVMEIFKSGRASISLGYIGIHETINALYKGQGHVYDNAELAAKAIKIVAVLKAAVDQWKEETGYAFSLYGTPSENLCNRFCKLDAKEFGVIEGVTDKGYYTNSFHLDVEKQVNPYDKIDFEMPFPALSSGGFICYGEFPNMERNIEALENVWDYSYDRVPYYGTNTPIDECYECGYTGEFECKSKGFVCPKCGNHDPLKVSVTRRVCGYLGSAERPFNEGKQEEVSRRVKHL